MRLSYDVDELVWNLSKYGKYSPKDGYLHLMLDKNEMEYSWWWKVLWKLKCPLKSKIFCWFLFSDKALTWDVIVRKGKEGPRRCYLCKMNAESNFHLGVDFPFTKSVWLDIEDKLKISNLWSGESVSDCMKNWCLNMEVKHIRSLPIIVMWFIWKARNQCCFEDFIWRPSQISCFSLGMLRSFPSDKSAVKIRSVFVSIDKTYPWGYFDGLTTAVPNLCGVGGMLYIFDDHFFL